MVCFNCEKEITDDYEMTADGYPICKHCMENGKFFKCKSCGEVLSTEFEESVIPNLCTNCFCERKE